MLTQVWKLSVVFLWVVALNTMNHGVEMIKIRAIPGMRNTSDTYICNKCNFKANSLPCVFLIWVFFVPKWIYERIFKKSKAVKKIFFFLLNVNSFFIIRFFYIASSVLDWPISSKFFIFSEIETIIVTLNYLLRR